MAKKLLKCLLPFAVLGAIIITSFLLLKNNYIYKLKGEKKVKIELNENYTDAGFEAKLFKHDLSKKVKVNNKVDNSKVGSYNIKYTLKLLGHRFVLNRTVKVIDSVPPFIELNGSKEINLYVGDVYVENGVNVTDNYDTDLTEKVKISGTVDTAKEGTYEIVYSVADSSGNESSNIRTIIVEKKKAAVVKDDSDSVKVEISDPIVKYIKEHDYKVSIGYYNLVTGKEYYYQADKIYYGASLIKTLDAIYLYENNLINDETMPYLSKAISISDNNSHLHLVDYIGLENLKSFGNSLGATHTLIGDDYYGSTNVRDQMVYWKKMYQIALVNDELKNLFINDYGNSIKINGLITMHKYGFYGQYYHDVGIIFDQNPYIIIVLTNHGNNNDEAIVNDISNLMYKYHLNQL